MNPALLTDDAGGVPPAEWHAAAQLLFREAEILDAGRLTDWLELVAPAIDYRILNRVTRERSTRDEAFRPDNFFVRCDRASLEARIGRLSSEYAWSEQTVVTTRRFVTNVRVEPAGDELRVRSNLLLFRARWESSAFISAERHDRWVRNAARLLLAERCVYLDHTVLPVENLAVLL
jgi:3-phenylpropionate/cinnamic acid dioxygenase small subunit